MDIALIIIFVLYAAVIAIVLALTISDVMDRQREFDMEAQRLVRQIKEEAGRKSFNADNMILNALKRLLQDVKSI